MGGLYADLLKILVILAVVVVHGYFVVTEYALVTLRKTRIQQLAAAGDRRAALVLATLDDLQELIAAVQLGVTMASLALGALAEPTIAQILEPTFAFIPAGWAPVTGHAVAIALTFVIITAVDIVIAELAPKTIALQSGERIALLVIRPIRAFIFVFRPFIALLNIAGAFVVGLVGFKATSEGSQAHSAEEFKLLVAASARAGVFDADEQEMLYGVLEFSRLTARQVMVPRTEVAGLEIGATREQVYEAVRTTRHTRFPVYRGTIDDIAGILYVRDLLARWPVAIEESFDLRRIMRVPLFVYWNQHIDDVLGLMKRGQMQIAVVSDEFGGTEGIVTLEDILERIVGDVRDEFEAAPPEIVELPGGDAEIDGTVLVSDVNERFGLHLDEDEADTLGGLVFFSLGRQPQIGDTFDGDGFRLRVERLDGRRIDRVRLIRSNAATPQAEAAH